MNSASSDFSGVAATIFTVLRDGVINFEGDAEALRKSTDPYIVNFLS